MWWKAPDEPVSSEETNDLLTGRKEADTMVAFFTEKYLLFVLQDNRLLYLDRVAAYRRLRGVGR